MTGTYSGQIVMQGFMRLQIRPWQRVLLTRSIAIIPTMIFATIFSKDNRLLDEVNLWLNIVQSLQLPFALVPVLVYTSKESVMGRFRNGKRMIWFTGLFGVMVIVINIYLVVDQLIVFELPWYVLFLTGIVGTVYLAFIAYLALEDRFVEYWNKIFKCCPLNVKGSKGYSTLTSSGSTSQMQSTKGFTVRQNPVANGAENEEFEDDASARKNARLPLLNQK